MHKIMSLPAADVAADQAEAAALWAQSPIGALAAVLHAAERALETEGFFADPDEAGDLSRSIDVVRELIAQGIGASALLSARLG